MGGEAATGAGDVLMDGWVGGETSTAGGGAVGGKAVVDLELAVVEAAAAVLLAVAASGST